MTDLKQLNQIIPFKWRVQSEVKNTNPPKFKMIAYVDARDVAEHLDKIVGRENWCDKYEEVKDTLFCSIGIRINNEWVFKSDCGVPSKIDKEKGESSDAFKRAGVKWGINRDAYRVGLVELNGKAYNGKNYPVDKDGKWLKGKEINDYCNKIANIEDLENYELDLNNDEISLFFLKELYQEKKESLSLNEQEHFDRIIKGNEKKSYQKSIDYLKNL
jgi:hypothetical protein